MKDGWVDRIGKYAALAAVILAIVMAVFDYKQSENQDETFNSFQEKLDSTFNIQLRNAREQHQKTIETLERQQRLMKIQNDSTIKLLKIQADRLKAQNDIWKINQKNEIHANRVKISSFPKDCFIKNDTLMIKFYYSNSGQRIANNIDCKIGIFLLKGRIVEPLLEETPPFSMKKIIPGSNVDWSINKDFPKKIGANDVYIYSRFSYEDEMYQNKFVTTEFIRVFNKDGKTETSFCSQDQINLISIRSKYKDIEIEDFTIKKEFLFK